MRGATRILPQEREELEGALYDLKLYMQSPQTRTARIAGKAGIAKCSGAQRAPHRPEGRPDRDHSRGTRHMRARTAGGAGTPFFVRRSGSRCRASRARPREEVCDQVARTMVRVLQGKGALLRRMAPRRTGGPEAVRAFGMRGHSGTIRTASAGMRRSCISDGAGYVGAGAPAAGIWAMPARFSVKARADTPARTLERRLGWQNGTRGSGPALRNPNKDVPKL